MEAGLLLRPVTISLFGVRLFNTTASALCYVMDADGRYSPWSSVSVAFEPCGCLCLCWWMWAVRLYSILYSSLQSSSSHPGVFLCFWNLSWEFWLSQSLPTPGVIFSLRQFVGLAACSPHSFSISPGSSPVLTEVQYHEDSCPYITHLGLFIMGESYLWLHLI